MRCSHTPIHLQLLPLNTSVGVVVNILALCMRCLGFDPQLCHNTRMCDVLIIISAEPSLQIKEVKPGTGSVPINKDKG